MRGAPAQAVPAAPIEFVLTQPDGSAFAARQWGDEWTNGLETSRGYAIVRDRVSGYWVYATVDASGDLEATDLRVGLDPPRGLPMHLRPDPPQVHERPSIAAGVNTGTQPSLVILVQFPDQASAGPTTPAAWNAKFFGATNSVADYYDEVSFGQLTIAPALEGHGTANDGVVGWLTMAYNHPNPGGNTGAVNRALTRDAVLAADPFVNFAGYDANHDGYLSGAELHVTVIVAGYEGGYSDPACTGFKKVWGHQWTLLPAEQPTVDGVVFGDFAHGGGYTQFGEMHCTHMATVGIMVHEMGHDLSLPDLYDTDASNGDSEGVGEWSVMGSGSWNALAGSFAGSSPAHPDPFSRAYEGWASPQQLVGTNIGKSIPQIETTGTVFQLLANPGGIDWTFEQVSGTGEYFLLENRQNTGYDAGLRGCGLLIWHIDETRTSQNTANADESRKLVDLEEADGLNNLDNEVNRGDAGDPYPGSTNNRTFDQTSNPSSALYGGAASGVSVTNISACSPTMSADIVLPGGGPGGPTITSFTPTSGPVGTSVVITGTNLTGATAVRFGGVAAVGFTVNSATQITAIVPAGAVTGPVGVTTPAGTATSAGVFTVTTAAGPTITSFAPTSGPVGTIVTITGTNLNGATSVTFGGVASLFTVNSPTQITATVPVGAVTGPITVTTPIGVAASATAFTVTTSTGAEHARSVAFFRSGNRAMGQVSVNDGFAACASGVPLKLQEKRGHWITVATGSTSGTGAFRATGLELQTRYRVVAPRRIIGADVCLKATSPTLLWT